MQNFFICMTEGYTTLCWNSAHVTTRCFCNSSVS